MPFFRYWGERSFCVRSERCCFFDVGVKGRFWVGLGFIEVRELQVKQEKALLLKTEGRFRKTDA